MAGIRSAVAVADGGGEFQVAGGGSRVVGNYAAADWRVACMQRRVGQFFGAPAGALIWHFGVLKVSIFGTILVLGHQLEML